MKQALIEGATRLHDNNMFEQGYGKLNILRSMKILTEYKPKVTLSPPYLDCTEDYMWPYSTQSLFHTSLPTIVNVTILNGVSVTGRVIHKPTWHPYILQNGNLLNVSITYSEVLWPWSGWLGVKIGNSFRCFFFLEIALLCSSMDWKFLNKNYCHDLVNWIALYY